MVRLRCDCVPQDWDEGKDKIIEAMKGYNVERWCCNHCTGKVSPP